MEKRNLLVDLIKTNRLGDAINALEKATEGTPMHNQMILLAATHAEYVQLNRSATQDFQTLETQRARITQSLLSMLDELPPEALSKLPEVAAPQAPRATATASAPASKAYQAPPPQAASGGIPKWLKYGGAGMLLLLLILMLIPSEDAPAEATVPDTQVSAAVPETSPSTSSEQSSTPGTGQTEANEIKGMNATWVQFYSADENRTGIFEQLSGKHWRESSNGNADVANFNEVTRDEWTVYLRDDSRGLEIHLDLYRNVVHYKDDSGQSFDIYTITDAK